MAAFVDISILKNFSTIFTFILVFVIIYGLLEVFKIFGEGRRGIHAMIGVTIAFMVSLSTGVSTVIQTFTPWFTIMIIVIFFILFAVRMFGYSSADITAGFKSSSSILTFILIFSAIIILFSLGAGFGQQTLDQGQTNSTTTSVVTGNVTTPTNSGSFNQNLYNTLYHPKILGLILIMLIVVVAMLLLTGVDTA